MTPLPQDVLLLLLDPGTGAPLVPGVDVKYAVAGAVLWQLREEGRIALGEGPASGKVVVSSAEPVGDPVLDAVLRQLAADKPRPPHAVLSWLARDIRQLVLDELVDAGIVAREGGVVTGLVPEEERPEAARDQEDEARAAVARVLADPGAARGRDAGLIAMLTAAHAVAPAIEDESEGQPQDSDWITSAVTFAIG